jgi:hypothetical protein
LCYPGAKINKKGDIVFMGTHQVTKQWCEIRTTGAKIFQNCFTADTPVLTTKGCKTIVTIQPGDILWDGEQWVPTDGCLCRGTSEVGSWLGVQVTKEHPIFDGEVWTAVNDMTHETSVKAALWAGLGRKHGMEITPEAGVWAGTGAIAGVYDLLNCGPNSRFTIITEYGPVVVHNCVQATARDFFKYGQMKARDAGYQPVLVVYDELVTEAPDSDEYTAHGLEQLMSMNPPWGEDLPIAADGFEDYRYHKSLD